MSPGMWIALHDERFAQLSIYDAFQSRISAMVASTVQRKSKKRIKESDYRFFPDKSTRKSVRGPVNLLDKMRFLVGSMGIDVRRGND